MLRETLAKYDREFVDTCFDAEERRRAIARGVGARWSMCVLGLLFGGIAVASVLLGAGDASTGMLFGAFGCAIGALRATHEVRLLLLVERAQARQ